jgi:hypothetical protein
MNNTYPFDLLTLVDDEQIATTVLAEVLYLLVQPPENDADTPNAVLLATLMSHFDQLMPVPLPQTPHDLLVSALRLGSLSKNQRAIAMTMLDQLHAFLESHDPA